MNDLPKIYTFDNFRFDAGRLGLYRDDVLVKAGDKKTMQVLAVLLLNPNRLTTHEEIIETVWQDNPHGVTPGHIGQYISKLRKVFAEIAPEKNYIETAKGRGYSFVGDVSDGEASSDSKTDSIVHPSLLSEASQKSPRKNSSFIFTKPSFLFLSLIPILLIAFLGWTLFTGKNDEEEIKRVVKESQLYESLVLYKNPSSFDEAIFDKFWTKDLDTNLNYDRQRIRDSIKKLVAEGRRYGDETRCEQFEFQSVEINQNKDFAVVKTLEKWFIAVYFNDGTLQKNRTVGPYFVSYILRKVDGQWLIEKSNTARTNRPTPHVTNLEISSKPTAGKQFFVKISGQDFEPETVQIEVIGEGCPESKPCKVPNSALRENAKLGENVLETVPLTLASGNFKVIIRNGDSNPSDVLELNVP